MPIRATSVTILCQSRLFFPQWAAMSQYVLAIQVTILCQSRLFFPPTVVPTIAATPVGNHPLSIEAIFPTNGNVVGFVYADK